ncbi:MAG TPA: PIN domain-containing protein [Beijerinckiaceae bacterium]
MREPAAGSRIYVDRNIFIYFIEKVEPGYARARDFFLRASEVGATLCTSEITVAECLHKPYRTGDAQLVDTYEFLFERSGDVTLLPLSGAVAKRAAAAGARIGLKLVDAIHFVSALDEGCDLFVSADGQFPSTPSMAVVSLR